MGCTCERVKARNKRFPSWSPGRSNDKCIKILLRGLIFFEFLWKKTHNTYYSNFNRAPGKLCENVEKGLHNGSCAETTSPHAVVGRFFRRDEDKNQPLNRLEFSFNRFDSLSAQDRKMSLLWLRAARMCTRERVRARGVLCERVWPFLPGSLTILDAGRKREKRRTNMGPMLTPYGGPFKDVRYASTIPNGPRK